MPYREQLLQGPWLDFVKYQNDVFSGLKPYDYDYDDYTSNVGAQGVFYSVINKIFANKLSLNNIFFINSLFTALTITWFIYLVYKEFGKISATITFLGLFTGGWLTFLGSNIYWVLWAMLLPMVINFYYLYKLYHKKESVNWLVWLSLLFLSLFFKFASGFEYTSSVLMSMITPLFYFVLKYNLTRKEFFKLLFILSAVGLLAFFFAIFCWFLQVYFDNNDLSKTLEFIEFTIIKRTYNVINLKLGDQIYSSASISAPVHEVLFSYFAQNFWIPIFAFSCMGIYILLKRIKDLYPTLLVNFIAFLGSISWFILGKGHSYVHTFMNFILWYVPFIPFILILLGEFIQKAITIEWLAFAIKKYVKIYIPLFIITVIIFILSFMSGKEIRAVLQSQNLASYDSFYINKKADDLYLVVRNCDAQKISDKFFLKSYKQNDSSQNFESIKESYFSDLQKLTSYYPRYNSFCIAKITDSLAYKEKIVLGQLLNDGQEKWSLEIIPE